jgi:DNA polymerase
VIDRRQYEYLEAMGIPVWQHRDQVVESVSDEAVPASSIASQSDDIASLDWEALEARVRECQLCDLYRSRTQAVFGTGNRQADLMIIGEAPGADEDRQGEPFVGRAGQLLNAMLQAIGLQRQQVYIANILKCRPPNNRDPSPEEANLCQDYLFRQIALVQPSLILVLGRIAAHRLLQNDTPLSKLRGQFHTEPHTGIPMLITYHPAYLLRSPKEKRKAWQDLLSAKKRLHEAGGI